MPDRWAVPLEEGDRVDIEEAKRLFVEGPIRIREVRVTHDQCEIALQADELEQKNDHLEVLATAERLLDYVNGALFLTDTERRPLRILLGGTVRERGETDVYDRKHALVRLSGRIRVRASAWAVLTTDGRQSSATEEAPQRHVEAEALTLTTSDKAVAEVLSHLRANPDYPVLYVIYERIKRDVLDAQEHWNASGRTGARPEFPWTADEEERLRRQSQPFRHGDRNKWAGFTRETAMPLPEARLLVKTWVRKWLEGKRPHS